MAAMNIYDIYNYKILQNGFQNQVSRNCLQKIMAMVKVLVIWL